MTALNPETARVAASAAAGGEVPWTLVDPRGGETMFLLENHAYHDDRRKRIGKKSGSSNVAATASTADFHILLSEDYRPRIVAAKATTGAGAAASRRIRKSASDDDWVVV